MHIDANGRRLWIDVRGSGPPIALLPGGPGLAADYLDDVAALVDEAFTVVVVEPRGCGRSEGGGPYEVADFISDLDAIRARLGHERWTIGGHSFGADLALAYALERPTVAVGVVAISPGGLQDDRSWHRTYEEGIRAQRDQVPESGFPFDPAVHASATASWRAYIKQPDLLRRVAELPVPYVAILGAEDIRPSWPAKQVAALAPLGRVELIEAAGHCPWWTQPQRVAAAMLSIRSRPAPLA